MQSLRRLIRFFAPWIALGLAGALVAVYLRPGLLPRPPTDPMPPAAADATAVPSPGATTLARTVPAAGASGVASYADAIARVAPAVVNIRTHKVVLERQLPRQLAEIFPGVPEFRRREETSLGSGVILDAAGHVATNYHVIKGVQEILVQLADGRSTKAALVGTDPDTDLAILKIGLPRLTVMPLGHSDQLRVGDVVLAIGNSLGLGQTVTQGICSATGRSQLGLAMLENFIQTDAAINLGNSGGALVNAAGDLVGINSGVLSHEAGSEGIGFAIPVNLVRGVAAEIETRGRVVRGWSGLELNDLTDASGQPVDGVEVANIAPDGPGAKAGLRPGDLLTTLDDTPIANRQDFLGRIVRKVPGASVKLRGVRPGRGGFETRLPIMARPIER